MSVRRAARSARPSGTNMGAGPESDQQPDSNGNHLPWPRPRCCNTSSCQCVTRNAGGRPTGSSCPTGPLARSLGAPAHGRVRGHRPPPVPPPSPAGSLSSLNCTRGWFHVSPPRVRGCGAVRGLSWAKHSARLGLWFWPFPWPLTLCGRSSAQGGGDLLRSVSRSGCWGHGPRPRGPRSPSRRQHPTEAAVSKWTVHTQPAPSPSLVSVLR